MSYDAESLYKTAYQKMLSYRAETVSDKENVLNKVSQTYSDGHLDGIDSCLAILKSTHMILELDGDAE